MKTSLKTYIKVLIMNLFHPCWLLSGRRLTYVADDWSEIVFNLPLRLINRGPHGAIYGGSLYSALDAVPGIQLYMRLGPRYVVYDKTCTIAFIKPARGILYARSLVSDEEVSIIKRELETEEKILRNYRVELVDDEDIVHVVVEKVIHLAQKNDVDGYQRLI